MNWRVCQVLQIPNKLVSANRPHLVLLGAVMTILRASVAPVPIGLITIYGLMDENGDFYVGVPQAAALFETSTNTAARDFKRLMGKGFETSRLKTEFNRNVTLGIPLLQFEKLAAKLDRKGNKVAQDFRDDLVGLSLRQLFSDAFGIKFEEKERQEFLKTRQEGKQVRLTLTDAIDWYLKENAKKDEKDRRSANYVNFIYSNCSDLVNLGLFGRKSKRLCIDLKVADRSKLRDFLTTDELRWLSEIEDLGARLIVYQGFEPMDAVREAVSRVAIPRVDRTA